MGIVLGFVALALIGTSIRAVASDAAHGFNRHMMATLSVNIAGSFLLGVLSGSSANTITVLGVGGLGSLTTFSTFVSQIECVAREGSVGKAVGFAAFAIVAGVGAAWLGWTMAH